MKLLKLIPLFLLSGLLVVGCCQEKHVEKAIAQVVDSDKDGVLNGADACPRTPMGAPVDSRGCWVLQGVKFATNSATLTKASSAILNAAAAVIAKNPTLKIRVDGHTDNNGDATYNLGLSKRRANAVKAYLIKKGASAANLSAQGFGLTKPAASNDTKEGRAQNRRVELSVM
ncbi:MAG: OmpA family protein [Nitrospinae bacterium]|nr:OmpA family protein [Nitrospinota bacterium]